MSNTEIRPGSVSGWIAQLRQGDPAAINNLVARYFGKIAQYAEGRLRRGIRVTDDGEDIALTVLQAIAKQVSNGRYPDLQDRDDLWFMMIVIAQHAVIDRQRVELRRSKSGAPIHNMTDLLQTYNVELDNFIGREDSEARLLEIIDCWEELLRKLPDDRMRQVAQLKIQGLSNREVANELDLVPRTVDRKVNAISQLWQKSFREGFDA